MPLFVVDVEDGARFRFAHMNEAAEREFGLSSSRIIGQLFGDCLSGRVADLLTARYEACVRSGVACEFEDYADLIDGRRWFRTTLSPEHDPVTGQVVRIVAVSQNITGIKRRHAELTAFAHQDPLTGLANRRLFDVISQDAAAEAVYTNAGFALLVADLDDLKGINDAHGHRVGDEAIRCVADALASCCRAGETVARVGGDEFHLLLRETTSTGLSARVEAIVAAVSAGAGSIDHPDTISVSVGGAIWRPGTELDAALVDADVEMYRAKKARKSSPGPTRGTNSGRHDFDGRRRRV
ncbi:sensor domain-containing diguanylate cyclase [Aureimonas sp. SK2]|uniref:GGDEF domain-containing protein n=1 Tax=Aureimonas sp. SK2 TaxID=3015992 RepID=UPI0024439002|nr:sensor domain-containing diguanylate cyclase [Aureimonas sp. SK2]